MDFTARPDCQSCGGSGEGPQTDSVGNKGPCLACYFAPENDLVLLARAVTDHVRRCAFEAGIGSVGTGFFTADGRQAGASIARVSPDGAPPIFRLDDGGESFSDLRMDGVVDRLGVTRVETWAARVAAEYGCEWVERRLVIHCTGEGSLGVTATRLAACSVAIDAVRFA